MAYTRTGPGAVWRLTQVLVMPLMRMFVTLTIREGSTLPPTGPFILAPNHYSEVDPVIMGVATWRLGRIPRFLAKASLFRVPVLGAYLKAAGHIPVERQPSARTSAPLDASKRLIERGQGVIVYPEGTLTRDPNWWPMKGKTGAVRMALESGIPLYPAAHWGTHMIMGPYEGKFRLFPRPRIEVIVGEEMDLSPWRGKPVTRELLEDATDQLMRKITDLVARLRDETPPTELYQPTREIQEGRA